MNKEGNTLSLKDKHLSRKSVCIILALIIIAQTVMVTLIFAFKKEGFHSDEMWTYGYANSFFRQHIYVTPNGANACEQWMDGSELRDYIVVNDGEQFRFDAVWYNQKNDMHPPLYCAIVHFICSFFPNTFSRYYAYVLNFIAMVIGQIYLFRLSSRMFKSDFYGIAVCLIWGFSRGFINVNIFLRAYSLMVMLAVMLLFYHYRIYISEGKDSVNFFAVGAVIFTGAMMHHYFLVLSFAVCAMFCLYLLVKRNWKRLFIYAGSALGGVALSFLCFPQAISHMANDGPSNGARLSYRMPFMNGIKYCFSIMFSELSGLRISSFVYSGYAYVIMGIVILLAVAIPLCFLFRKEEWFIKFKEKSKNTVVSFAKSMDYFFLLMAVTVFFVVEIVAITVNLNGMAETSDRYLFFVMPYVILCAVMLIKFIFDHIKPISKFCKPVICILGCLCITFSNIYGYKGYYFQFLTRGEGGIETTASDESTYVALISNYWLLTVYPYKLLNCESIFVTTTDTYQYKAEEIASHPADDKTYVLIDTSTLTMDMQIDTQNNEIDENDYNGIKIDVEDNSFEDIKTEEDVIADFESQIYPGYKLQFYGSEYVFERMIHIFKVVPEAEYVDVPIVDASLERQALIEERRKQKISLGEE